MLIPLIAGGLSACGSLFAQDAISASQASDADGNTVLTLFDSNGDPMTTVTIPSGEDGKYVDSVEVVTTVNGEGIAVYELILVYNDGSRNNQEPGYTPIYVPIPEDGKDGDSVSIEVSELDPETHDYTITVTTTKVDEDGNTTTEALEYILHSGIDGKDVSSISSEQVYLISNTVTEGNDLYGASVGYGTLYTYTYSDASLSYVFTEGMILDSIRSDIGIWGDEQGEEGYDQFSLQECVILEYSYKYDRVVRFSQDEEGTVIVATANPEDEDYQTPPTTKIPLLVVPRSSVWYYGGMEDPADGTEGKDVQAGDYYICTVTGDVWIYEDVADDDVNGPVWHGPIFVFDGEEYGDPVTVRFNLNDNQVEYFVQYGPGYTDPDTGEWIKYNFRWLEQADVRNHTYISSTAFESYAVAHYDANKQFAGWFLDPTDPNAGQLTTTTLITHELADYDEQTEKYTINVYPRWTDVAAA